jgi:hypothetical protein
MHIVSLFYTSYITYIIRFTDDKVVTNEVLSALNLHRCC